MSDQRGQPATAGQPPKPRTRLGRLAIAVNRKLSRRCPNAARARHTQSRVKGKVQSRSATRHRSGNVFRDASPTRSNPAACTNRDAADPRIASRDSLITTRSNMVWPRRLVVDRRNGCHNRLCLIHAVWRPFTNQSRATATWPLNRSVRFGPGTVSVGRHARPKETLLLLASPATAPPPGKSAIDLQARSARYCRPWASHSCNTPTGWLGGT